MAARRFLLLLLTTLLVIGLGGCGGSMSAAPGYAGAPPAKEAQAGGGADMAPPEPMAEPGAARLQDEIMNAQVAHRAPPPSIPKPAAVSKDKRSLELEAERPAPTPAPQGQPTGADRPRAPATQLLVYTADVRVSVDDVRKSLDAVEKLARDRGGYLVSREDNRITIRVPTGQLDAALDDLGKLGEVLQRNMRVEDVTDKYFDLAVRMKNLEVVKKRLEELLAKASTVPEALAVQRELERVSTELERLKGQLELLRELILFSTITVVLQPKSSEHIDSRVRLPFPWMDRLGLGDLLRLE